MALSCNNEQLVTCWHTNKKIKRTGERDDSGMTGLDTSLVVFGIVWPAMKHDGRLSTQCEDESAYFINI